MQYLLCLLLLLPLPSLAMNIYSATNTPPQITEGEFLEIILQEDNSYEPNQHPNPYSIVLTATDTQYDKLTWSVAKDAKYGSVKMTGSNNVQTIYYTPALHYYGDDSFIIQVADVFGAIDTIEILARINPVNDSPTTLSTRTIEVPYGSPIQAYKLDRYFHDIDNKHDEMQYEIVDNSNPKVVQVRIKENVVNLIYKQVGKTQLTIKAIDPYGLYAITYFYVTVTAIESKIELSHAFPSINTISQPTVLFFQVTGTSGIDPTGLVTVSNGLQSCHFKLEPEHRGKGLCRITLPEYQEYIFQAEYEGDNNFMPSTTQQDFIYTVKPKVLIYHTKLRKKYELSEDGLGDSYAISLSQIPSDPVELTITPNEQLSVNEAQTITLTLKDMQPVEILIVPVDDTLVEGWHYGEIQHHTKSKDKDYHNINSTLYFPIQDNDPGIVIEQSNHSTEIIEEETTDYYAISLSTLPQKTVNIKIESYDNQAIAYPDNLIFTNENWSTAQNVQVSALPDTELEGEHSSMLLHTVRTQDTIYNNENIAFNINKQNTNTLDVSIIDNDAKQPPVAPKKFTAHVLEDNQILLTWEDMSDNENHFILKRDGIKIATLLENSNNYKDMDVRCGAVYSYELFGVNKKGASPNPVQVNVQTATCTELKAPSNLIAFLIEDKYINLVWDDTNNSEAGYLIERSNKEIARTSAHTVGYRDDNLSCSMTYEYNVKAFGFQGKQSPAAITSIRTPACKGKFTLILNIEGKGSVNGCDKQCTQYYPSNQEMNFQTRAAKNWMFQKWSGDCDSNLLLMDADKTCTAHFVEK
jgi:hypothetical protein